MWQILLLSLLASSVCGAAQRKVDQRKVLYEDSDISKESDDDYYNDSDNDNNDNSENDSLSIDIDIDYARQRLIPSHSSYRSASVSSSTTPPHAHLRRVPRHPWVSHRSGSDNRLDTYAAYHEEGYQSDQAPGSMTAQKLQEVGSPEAVQLSRRRYQEQQKIRTDELKRLASLHLESMQNEPLCKRPQARVIRMISETSIVYSPHATVLHRCDENSSCCQNNMVWAVKNQTTVEKVFWMRSINSRHSTATIVPMTNHTECHCINRPAQRRKRSSQCECPKHFINFAIPRGGTTSSTTTTSRCRCDCHLSNMTCQRMKNGDEGFAVSELKCIRSNDCSPPICSNGIFNLNTGRCPRSTQSQPRQLGFG